jgi:hypothetical protein
VSCVAPTTTWTASATAGNGKFKAGKAEVAASANGCDYTCAFAQAAGTITLTGGK